LAVATIRSGENADHDEATPLLPLAQGE